MVHRWDEELPEVLGRLLAYGLILAALAVLALLVRWLGG